MRAALCLYCLAQFADFFYKERASLTFTMFNLSRVRKTSFLEQGQGFDLLEKKWTSKNEMDAKMLAHF